MMLFARHSILSLLFIGIAVFAVGCASSGTVGRSDSVLEPLGPSNWSEVETVDISEYPDVPVVMDRSVKHDVPEILMKSQADDGVIEQVDGYRIQVFSSAVQNEAVQAEDRIRNWINALSQQRRNVLGIKTTPVIYHLYKQPYYRVRIGDFANRSQAQPIVNALKSSFPGALVVPDVIFVKR